MNRKERRSLGKQIGKDATSTVDLMLNLPSACLDCEKEYDRKNKQMAMTWFVEVFNAEKRVDLYCPECYEKRNHGVSKTSTSNV